MDRPDPVFRQKIIASSMRSDENIAAEKLAQWVDSGMKKKMKKRKKRQFSLGELLLNDAMHC